MMRPLLLCLLFSFSSIAAFAQDTAFPYKVNWVKDGAIVAGNLGATVVGGIIRSNKVRVTEQDIAGLSIDDVNRLDRFSAGNYSAAAERASNYPFYGSFLTPLLLLLDDDVSQNAPKVYLLYGQAMSLAGGLYSITAGLTKRKRPYLYSENAPLDLKTDNQATNSFYAGHTAATAAATFFVAKVYHDMHPDSNTRTLVWITAAAVPATVGYLRLKAGKHFLSDNLVGYAVGASIGILVPELHRKGNTTNIGFTPISTPDHKGVLLTYRF